MSPSLSEKIGAVGVIGAAPVNAALAPPKAASTPMWPPELTLDGSDLSGAEQDFNFNLRSRKTAIHSRSGYTTL